MKGIKEGAEDTKGMMKAKGTNVQEDIGNVEAPSSIEDRYFCKSRVTGISESGARLQTVARDTDAELFSTSTTRRRNLWPEREARSRRSISNQHSRNLIRHDG